MRLKASTDQKGAYEYTRIKQHKCHTMQFKRYHLCGAVLRGRYLHQHVVISITRHVGALLFTITRKANHKNSQKACIPLPKKRRRERSTLPPTRYVAARGERGQLQHQHHHQPLRKMHYSSPAVFMQLIIDYFSFYFILFHFMFPLHTAPSVSLSRKMYRFMFYVVCVFFCIPLFDISRSYTFNSTFECFCVRVYCCIWIYRILPLPLSSMH